MGSQRPARAPLRAPERASRMTDSKSGSKDNLNESNMPLLESEEKAEETPEKEVVQMELEEKEEKKDEVTEKDKKEEKKMKVPKVKKEPGPSCIDTLSSGLDLGARDSQGINVEIDLDFGSTSVRLLRLDHPTGDEDRRNASRHLPPLLGCSPQRDPRPGLRRCWWHLQGSTQARPVRLMNNFALFEKDFQRRSQFKTLRLIISVNVALLSMLTK